MNPTPTPDSPSPQPVDIARLRELLAKATPGPWDTHDMEGSNNTRLFYVGYYIGSIGNSDAPKVQNEIDADLIAALRNDAPALLDELERLRDDCAEKQEQIELLQGLNEESVKYESIRNGDLIKSLDELSATAAIMREALLTCRETNKPGGFTFQSFCLQSVITALSTNAGTELLADRDTLRIDLQHHKDRLKSDSIVASCDCGTKAPDIQHHAPGCKYRLISERDFMLRENAELKAKLESQ